jgi:hypothetical protein
MPIRHEGSDLDLRVEVSRASIVFLVRQDGMVFGSDRGMPLPSRPVVLIRRRDPFWFVLPSTTQSKSKDRSKFFAIRKTDVIWKNSEKARDGFLYHRYESLNNDDLIAKIGVLIPAVQVEIVKWLRSQY